MELKPFAPGALRRERANGAAAERAAPFNRRALQRFAGAGLSAAALRGLEVGLAQTAAFRAYDTEA